MKSSISMSNHIWLHAFCGVMAILLFCGIAHGQVGINEFVASNREGLQDEDGAYPDWIELYNSGDAWVPLFGWSLTDNPMDPDRWTFPDIMLGPGEYLVVFASGKDRRPTDGNNLHTNFELNASGEYLALYNASGQPQLPSVFDPEYPAQAIDVSYGLHAGTGLFRYFDTPTPGTPNVAGNSYGSYAGPVEFSRSGGTFTDPLSLELTAAPGTLVRYTLDGSLPTETSPSYTDPITVSTTTQVRAQASGADMLPGPVANQVYMALDSSIEDFESTVPLVVVDSFGFDIDSEDYGDRPFRPVLSVFIDTDDGTGRTTITDEADYAGCGAMHVRGASTAGYEKKQYRFDTRDQYDQDIDVPLLGFPAEADWILHAPYSDKTLMRNYMVYDSWWRGRMGRTGVRTKFVELFFDKEGDGVVAMEDYAGVYVFMEKVKRGNSRVDIAELQPYHNSEPEITGGYIFRHDWDWDPGFETDIYHDYLVYEEPEWDEITPEQAAWIKAYCDEFEAALSGPDFADPDEGYAKYVDVGSFIDNQIMVEIGRNVDGYVLSTFFYKDRGGKITLGPVWDYNGSLGGADYFESFLPEGWHHALPGFPFDNENSFHWWERMMEDPEYLLQFADRWFDLREDALVTAGLMQEIDENAALLTDNGAPDSPVDRNFYTPSEGESYPADGRWNIDDELWPNYYDNNHDDTVYSDYVNWMKEWITARLDWMDGAIADEYGAAPPIFYADGARLDTGGHVQPGDSLTMELPEGASGTIYYTLDGSNPRGTSIEYTAPITLTDTSHVKARIRDGDTWSALNKATFYTRDLSDALRVTEIMYHPAGGGAEFIELHNAGGNSEDISGVNFSEGIEFTFPANTILPPGEYVVLVSTQDEASFLSQYPGIAIGGLYEFKLDNGGERIDLSDANGTVFKSFRYDDDPPWPIETDGLGYSLVRADTEGDPNDHASWNISREVGGSPGEQDSDVTAAFTAFPASGSRPLTVEFTDESTGPVTSWSWDFGDGYTSTEQNPTHTYYLAGDHTVTLHVASANGSDTETGLIHADETVVQEGNRYKTFIGDIKVAYTKGGCLAWHNELDNTLRIEIWEDAGNLTLTCRDETAAYWDSRCDVYIYAPDVSVKTINLKGTPETQLYVCGQVGYVKNFMLKYGHVGDTLAYGPDVGLGSAALDPPNKIFIKEGWSTAPVLGVGYPELRFDAQGAEEEVGAVELKPKPFEILLDEEDDGADGPAVAAAEASVETKAGYTYEHGGIKVRYSKPGCEAYYDSDPDMDIIVIRVFESEGNLTVNFGQDVYYYWEDYCDIYIDAPDASINTINLKGRPETTLYVCGEVASVNNFKLKNGVVGDTGLYGPDVGLINTSLTVPAKIKIIKGWATAPVLGVYND